MKYVSISSQSFSFIVRNGLFYIDKTPFIYEWFERKDAVTIITRPRRFGKTLLLDMMNTFFGVLHLGERDVFNDLAIAKDSRMKPMMEMQGQIPAIALSFAGIRGRNLQEWLFNLGHLFLSKYLEYRFILDDESHLLNQDCRQKFQTIKSELFELQENYVKDPEAIKQYILRIEYSLQDLSWILEQYYGKKVYIFIDEYDTPLEHAFEEGFYDEALLLWLQWAVIQLLLNLSSACSK